MTYLKIIAVLLKCLYVLFLELKILTASSLFLSSQSSKHTHTHTLIIFHGIWTTSYQSLRALPQVNVKFLAETKKPHFSILIYKNTNVEYKIKKNYGLI